MSERRRVCFDRHFLRFLRLLFWNAVALLPVHRREVFQGLRRNGHDKSLVAYSVRPVNRNAAMDTIWRMQQWSKSKSTISVKPHSHVMCVVRVFALSRRELVSMLGCYLIWICDSDWLTVNVCVCQSGDAVDTDFSGFSVPLEHSFEVGEY